MVAFSTLKSNNETTRKNPLVPSFEQLKKRQFELIPSGILEVDRLIGGLPRGAITEVLGPSSSGRTSFFLSVLARATRHQETCALVDVNDTLDVSTAAQAGVDFDKLLWIRCGSKVEHGFKAADFLLQSGGFGLVVLDLGDVSTKDARQIQSSCWYRFQRAIENTPTALVIVGQITNARWCASLILDLKREQSAWSATTETATKGSSPEFQQLLCGLRIHVERRKPTNSVERETRFEAVACDSGK